MPHVWLTIEEAAVTLRTSVRTLQRKVSAGTIESRMENGRREVLVDVADPSLRTTSADMTADASTSSAFVGHFGGLNGGAGGNGGPSSFGSNPPTAAHVVGQSGGASVATADLSQALAVVTDAMADKAELAIVAYQGLARNSELMASRYRTETRIYQVAAAVLVVCVVVAVGVAVRSATRVEAFDHRAQEAHTATASVGQERDRLRDELWRTREAAARAEGRREGESAAAAATMTAMSAPVSVVKASANAEPTTRPTTHPTSRPTLDDNFATSSDGSTPAE